MTVIDTPITVIGKTIIDFICLNNYKRGLRAQRVIPRRAAKKR